ncbi:MAG TPA: hypothetical protein VE258_17435 [Ktedonobacterales bacterium]|nr:hypothetical protein [Ktedonobacterales bacterium]
MPDLASLAAFIAAMAGIIVIFITLRHLRLAREARYDSCRPLLYPSEQPTLARSTTGETVLGLPAAGNRLIIHNAGSGVATNVRGAIYGPPPVELAEPGSPPPDHQYIWLETPLPDKASTPVASAPGGWILPGDTSIVGRGADRPTLFAPLKPTPGSHLYEVAPTVIWRLTLTYQDIFRRKHASVFDFTDQFVWRCVGLFPGIPKDIEELDRARRGQTTPHPATTEEEMSYPQQ